MTTYFPELAARVHGQREHQPELYGAVDFDHSPHRFTTDPAVRSALPQGVSRADLLADDRLVDLIRTGTMLGDVVADPYACLAPEYGVRGLIEMLRTACRSGIGAVPDAPPELHAFVASMAATPSWLDMDLVEQGARELRVVAAFLTPFVIRGAFLGTFRNTYAALPMALTGALSGRRAARRVNETASFFAVTTLPGALERFGAGFEAAAMVRLMHSMVRYHALRPGTEWDTTVYGVPVPQVDQMPAGQIEMFRLATAAVRRGRAEFTPRERAMLELCRYRCFLLGMPEEFLPTTPAAIVRLFNMRYATLRYDFDDATCGALVRSTMDADLRPGRTRRDRLAEAVERSWSKVAFLAVLCRGDRALSASMSVRVGTADLARVALTAPFVLGRFLTVTVLSQVGPLRTPIDAYTLRVLKRRLATYGNPEYTTDGHDHPAH